MNQRLQRSTTAMIFCMTLIVPMALNAQEPAGRWAGRWTTHKENGRGHQGTLRVNLRPNGDGTYQGLFAGRFAVVIPYFYRATVVQEGDTLSSSKRLGPFGNYQMYLHHAAGSLSGGWSMGSDSGGIQLYRR